MNLDLYLIERPTQASLRPHSAFSILERWCISLVSGSMSVPSCLRTMRWSTPPDQLPLSSLQEVSAFPLHHSIRWENADGVNNKVALQVAAPSCVNNVNSSLTVPRSIFAFIGVDSQQKVGLPRLFRAFNDSCSSASAPSLHQPLLPPNKVSPIRVDKLRQEVLTYPDQSFVTWMVFRTGFVLVSTLLRSP